MGPAALTSEPTPTGFSPGWEPATSPPPPPGKQQGLFSRLRRPQLSQSNQPSELLAAGGEEGK